MRFTRLKDAKVQTEKCLGSDLAGYKRFPVEDLGLDQTEPWALTFRAVGARAMIHIVFPNVIERTDPMDSTISWYEFVGCVRYLSLPLSQVPD